ncbi:hypothetical protein BDZ97DRAFT_685973 [Flammula alnicola]|nr:hypothetical protein BDZ97DRAFT_685973 [Flammula alnicola]
MLGHVLHLPRVQKRAGGGFLQRFDAVRVSSTSLACKSELEVILWRFDGVHTSSTPSCTKRAGGGFLLCFDNVRVSSTSLACKSEPGVVFTAFRRGLCVLHLPRMPEVDLYGVLTPFVCPPPPSRTKASRGGPLSCFNAVRAFFTSLACKSEPEVVLLRFDDVRASSTSLACKNEPEVVFIAFRRRLCVLHLPRVQKQVGGGPYGVSTPFSYLPPPSHANASRRWFCRVSTLLGQAGGHFDTVRTSSTSLACKNGQGGSLITF